MLTWSWPTYRLTGLLILIHLVCGKCANCHFHHLSRRRYSHCMGDSHTNQTSFSSPLAGAAVLDRRSVHQLRCVINQLHNSPLLTPTLALSFQRSTIVKNSACGYSRLSIPQLTPAGDPSSGHRNPISVAKVTHLAPKVLLVLPLYDSALCPFFH